MHFDVTHAVDAVIAAAEAYSRKNHLANIVHPLGEVRTQMNTINNTMHKVQAEAFCSMRAGVAQIRRAKPPPREMPTTHNKFINMPPGLRPATPLRAANRGKVTMEITVAGNTTVNSISASVPSKAQ
jgi:hypothetical protein